jgi:hypothetical protein
MKTDAINYPWKVEETNKACYIIDHNRTIVAKFGNLEHAKTACELVNEYALKQIVKLFLARSPAVGSETLREVREEEEGMNSEDKSNGKPQYDYERGDFTPEQYLKWFNQIVEGWQPREDKMNKYEQIEKENELHRLNMKFNPFETEEELEERKEQLRKELEGLDPLTY